MAATVRATIAVMACAGVAVAFASDVRNASNASAEMTETIVSKGVAASAKTKRSKNPTVMLTASSALVPYGGTFTLAWNSTNATRCIASGGWTGDKTVSGTVVVSDHVSSQTFTLTCTGKKGTAAQSVLVEAGAPVSVSLALSSAAVRTRDSVSLTWSSTNASSCSATGAWSGVQSTSGSVQVSSSTAGTLNYGLTCSNAAGQSASGTAALAVRARTAGDYYVVEDTGLVIPNDNADTTRFFTSIARLDLNADGYEDSIIVGPELPNGPAPSPLPTSWFKTQTAHVVLGGPTASEGSAFFPQGRPSYKVSNYPVVYDFNGDGILDVVVPDMGPDTDPFPGAQTNIYLSGGGVWRPAVMQQAMAGPHGGSAGTIAGKRVFLGNNLGCGFCIELTPFTYEYVGGAFALSRATLPALMTDTGPGVTTAAAHRWTASAIADLDGDGISDLVLGDFGPGEPNDSAPGNYLVLGSANGWKGTPLRLPDPQGPAPGKAIVLTVVVADMNNDGRPDIVMGYTDNSGNKGIQILIRSGSGDFVDASTAMLGASAYVTANPTGQLTVMDLNGDQCLDIVEPEPSFSSAQKGRWLFSDCVGHFVDGTAALAPVLNALPNSQVLLPFKDYTGRTSFYAPAKVAPASGSDLAGSLYRKVKNLENLPTPANGVIVF